MRIGELDLVESFFIFLKDPLGSVVSTLRLKLTTPSFPVSSYGDSITTFRRLYISEKSGKAVFGVLQDDTAVVQYKNLNGDSICNFAKAFTLREGGSNSGIECKKDGTSTYLLLQGNQLTTFQPEDAWADVTAKVRLE